MTDDLGLAVLEAMFSRQNPCGPKWARRGPKVAHSKFPALKIRQFFTQCTILLQLVFFPQFIGAKHQLRDVCTLNRTEGPTHEGLNPKEHRLKTFQLAYDLAAKSRWILQASLKHARLSSRCNKVPSMTYFHSLVVF